MVIDQYADCFFVIGDAVGKVFETFDAVEVEAEDDIGLFDDVDSTRDIVFGDNDAIYILHPREERGISVRDETMHIVVERRQDFCPSERRPDRIAIRIGMR